MNFKQSFTLALKSLKTSKMRSFLTMLGIIIGVAAVIILVSLVAGFSADLSSSLESMGTNLISVTLMGRNSNRAVTADEMQELALNNSDVIIAMTPMVSTSATLKYGDESEDSATLLGVNEYYDVVKNINISSGRMLQYIDVERRQKVCIIGQYQADTFFAGNDPLGQTLKINGNSFIIVGVLEETADGEEGTNDDQVIIPYTVASYISQSRTVSSYAFSAVDAESVDTAESVIDDFLLSEYGSDDAYMVMNQADMIETLNELTGTLTLILVGIAGISLLVGGIGIMNIMLVSVTERTREIGIRKSLGGKRKDIMRQFVIEAATTSSIGGVVGIVVGMVLAYLGGKLLDITIVFSLYSIILAAGVSIAIGIAFGYFPAAKAAKLHPIEALRHE